MITSALRLLEAFDSNLRKQETPLHERTIVYFVQAREGGPIKVGTCAADRVYERLDELQVGNPSKLVVRRTLYAAPEAEHLLHRDLSALRVRGEWFHANAELAEFARAIPQTFPNLQQVA